MRVINFLFLLLISYSVFSQEIPHSYHILTQEQNNQWFDQLEKLDFISQLSVVKNRVLQDSCIYVDNTTYCGMLKIEESKVKPKDKVKGCYKPLLIFDSEIINNTSGSTPNKAVVIAGFLNDDKIKEIKVFRNASAAALYGSVASEGAILFTFKHKESLTVMKEILAGLK